MALKDMPYTEGAAALISSMSGLTLLRPALQERPFQQLYALLLYLLHRDAHAAADCYHALFHALLTGGYRRVSGDLFRDFLFYVLLERENEFSDLAAYNSWDEPLCAAMRLDLTQLSPCFELNSVTVKRWIGDCYREQKNKPRQQQPDAISVLSSAVWGGSGRPSALPATPAKPAQELPALLLPSRPLDENMLPSWRYQNDPAQEEHLFVTNTALEELYHRLDHAPDRGILLDDVWNFHATYGTGMFIRDRFFRLDALGMLHPIPQQLMPQEDSYTFYQQQREQCLRNAIRFMRGEPAQNMLLTGGAGTGKTTQVFSLCRELPELRLIACAPSVYQAVPSLISHLMRQPLRFAIFLDDFNPTDVNWPALKSALAPAGQQPENILLIAAAHAAETTFFPLHVQLPPPQLKDFIELVQMLLLREGQDVDFDSIQNACIDYAAAMGGNKNASPLSFRSAEVIADSLALEP